MFCVAVGLVGCCIVCGVNGRGGKEMRGSGAGSEVLEDLGADF